MTLVLIYAFVFVAVLLFMDVALNWFFRSRKSTQEVNSRLRHLKKSKNQVAAYEAILGKRGISYNVENILSGQWLSRMYSQSGIEMQASQRRMVLILLVIAGWFAASFLPKVTIYIQPFVAIFLAYAAWAAFVLYKRRKRMQLFVLQLADAIDIIVRSLQAGHPLNAAISLVAKEMPDPIGSEFGILNDQLSFGEDLETGMMNLYNRVGVEELKLLTVTVTVQKSTGGNLAEILENLSAMIRDRIMLKAKIRAISAEGRMTAVVMALFPFGLFLMIRALVPTYFDPLIETGWASTVVIVCLVIMSIGMVILNRLVNFDF